MLRYANMFLASGGFGRMILVLQTQTTGGDATCLSGQLDPRGESVSLKNTAPVTLHKCYLGPKGPLWLLQSF